MKLHCTRCRRELDYDIVDFDNINYILCNKCWKRAFREPFFINTRVFFRNLKKITKRELDLIKFKLKIKFDIFRHSLHNVKIRWLIFKYKWRWNPTKLMKRIKSIKKLNPFYYFSLIVKRYDFLYELNQADENYKDIIIKRWVKYHPELFTKRSLEHYYQSVEIV